MYTWDTPEQESALGLAMKRKVKGLTEFEVAEFILMAESSLWYTQVKHYAQEPTPIPSEGAKAILELVQHGYSDQRGWWFMPTLWTAPNEMADKTLAILQLLIYVEFLRTQGHVISRGFDILAELLFGAQWKRLAVASITQATMLQSAARNTYDPVKPCINPYCTNGDEGKPALVDRRKKKSGACCKACMNYECTHPECVAKAQAKGWIRYTHPWGSKIAERHIGWRKGR